MNAKVFNGFDDADRLLDSPIFWLLDEVSWTSG